MCLKSFAILAARCGRDLRLQDVHASLLGGLRLVESPNDPLPSLSHVFSPSDGLVVDTRSSHLACDVAGGTSPVEPTCARQCRATVPQARGTTWHGPPRRGRSWPSKPTGCNEDPFRSEEHTSELQSPCN